jgi:hypothetical protein
MDEVCANCGEFTSRLNRQTGWCQNCSTGEANSLSLYHKVESFLAANADEIEHYLLQGHTLNQAIDLVHKNGRKKCLVCGEPILRGHRAAVFCRRTAECRRYSRKYIYLYQEKGLSKPEALAQVMGELT